MIIKALLFVIVLVVAQRTITFLISLGILTSVYNHRPGPCRLIPEIDNGAEDLELFPDGTVIISSGLRLPGFGNAQQFLSSKGEFRLFDFNHPEKNTVLLKIITDSKSKLDVENMSPHGISVYREPASGSVYLFVVNHSPQGDVVEKFLYVQKNLILKHIETFKDPLFHHLNDVVAIGSSSFYATNLIYFQHTIPKHLELFLGLPLSTVVLYNQDSGARVVAKGFLLNGISMSSDQKSVYVAQASTPVGFNVYSRAENGDLNYISTQSVGMGVDNIGVLSNGDIVIGTQYRMIDSLTKLSDRRKHSPSRVLYLKMKNNEVQSMSSLLEDDGEILDGASMATVYGDKLLIGTFCEKLMYCEIKVPY